MSTPCILASCSTRFKVGQYTPKTISMMCARRSINPLELAAIITMLIPGATGTSGESSTGAFSLARSLTRSRASAHLLSEILLRQRRPITGYPSLPRKRWANSTDNGCDRLVPRDAESKREENRASSFIHWLDNDN